MRGISTALGVLGVLAASPGAAQDVFVGFSSGIGSDGLPFRTALVIANTFDIGAETLTVRALFRIRTVADRAEGTSRMVVCRYRNRRALSEGSTRLLYWLGCDRERPEPRTFERLEGASVVIVESGRSYLMRCEDAERPLIAGDTRDWAGMSFDCWVVPDRPVTSRGR